jgi:rhodanese-related sulfurtransferase
MTAWIKQMFWQGLLISCVAAGLAFTVNALSPRGIALTGQWDVKKGVISAKAKHDFVKQGREIELPAAKVYYNEGILFVDARPPEEYKAGHIKGAVSFGVDDFYGRFGAFRQKFPDSTFIVCYCNGRECPDSHELAENLENAGYTHIKVFIDGYPVWEQEGLPVEK